MNSTLSNLENFTGNEYEMNCETLQNTYET